MFLDRTENHPKKEGLCTFENMWQDVHLRKKENHRVSAVKKVSEWRRQGEFSSVLRTQLQSPTRRAQTRLCVYLYHIKRPHIYKERNWITRENTQTDIYDKRLEHISLSLLEQADKDSKRTRKIEATGLMPVIQKTHRDCFLKFQSVVFKHTGDPSLILVFCLS